MLGVTNARFNKYLLDVFGIDVPAGDLYQPSKYEEASKAVRDEFLALLLLQMVNRKRYGHLLVDMDN